MKGFLKFAFLLITPVLMLAQAPVVSSPIPNRTSRLNSIPVIGFTFTRVSGQGSTVSIPAGMNFIDANDASHLAVTICSPVAPATTCIVTGTVFVKRMPLPQAVIITKPDGTVETRTVSSIIQFKQSCPPGTMQIGHGISCGPIVPQYPPPTVVK